MTKQLLWAIIDNVTNDLMKTTYDNVQQYCIYPNRTQAEDDLNASEMEDCRIEEVEVTWR